MAGSIDGHTAIRSIQTPDIAVRCEGLWKSFGGQVALRDVSISIERGCVTALVGQNGAGKSTFLGILAGRVRPDSGNVQVGETPMHLGDPRESRAAAIACIYQKLTMVPNLSACENVFLGQAITHHGHLATSAMKTRFLILCGEFGIDLNPRTPAGRLSIAQQQILEIMRGLQAGAQTLLFDEPTAALPISERKRVYDIIETLRTAGKTIILVSHKLDEVLENSQRITVMRNGAIVASGAAEEWTEETLITEMAGGVGRDVMAPHQTPRSNARAVAPLLEAIDLSVPGLLTVPQLRVHRGEVLGITGLVGSGRSSLLNALAGLQPGTRGSLIVNGTRVSWPKNPRQALKLGIAMIAENRDAALIMGLSISDNVGIGYDRSERLPWILTPRFRSSYARSHLAGLPFDRNRLNEPIRNLSGGNQQKVLIAKWAGRKMDVLLADEPTQGIDVSAKAEVLDRLRELADNEKGVIIVSSEIDEILNVCDRALVMWRGSVIDEVERGNPSWNHESLLRKAFGNVLAGASDGN